MRPGDELDGFRITAIGSTRDGVASFRVLDGSGPAELLWVPPAAAPRFLAAHRALAALGLERAVVGTSFLERADGAGVVRPATEDLTLERLAGPLAVGVAAAIGADLVPCLVGDGSLDLRADDLRTDGAGRVVLAPRFGRPEPIQPTAARDLAVLLHRWWTGRAGTGPAAPIPTAALPGLDPRCDEIVAALWQGDLPAASRLLTELATPVDLRPLLTAHPASRAILVTRTPTQLEPVRPPWRTVGWALGLGLWATSALAALTVVLLPLSVLGFVLGAAAITAGEVVGRRSVVAPLPRLPRTPGPYTPAFDAFDRVRERLSTANLAEAPASDVRTLLAGWEQDLVESSPARTSPEVAVFVQQAQRLEDLLARFDDDDAASAELARWVRTGAP